MTTRKRRQRVYIIRQDSGPFGGGGSASSAGYPIRARDVARPPAVVEFDEPILEPPVVRPQRRPIVRRPPAVPPALIEFDEPIVEVPLMLPRRRPTWSSYTTALTGTQNDVDFQNATQLRCDNAADLTITGLKPGVPGQQLTIISTGAGNVLLSHEDGGSTAAYRLTNVVTTGKTPLGAGKGAARLEYDGTTSRWRLVAHEQGEWITPTFAAGDFTGNGLLTVTVAAGNIQRHAYYIRGKEMAYELQVQNFTTGGTPNTNIQVLLPGGFNVSGSVTCDAIVVSNGAAGFEHGRMVTTAVNQLSVQRAASANWPNGAGNNQLYVNVILPI